MPALDDVKAALRVTHDDDDALLNRLIDSSLLEYLRFTGQIEDGMTMADVSEDAFNGIVLMVQADYDGDPTKRDRYVEAARGLWQPMRIDMGL